MDLTNQLLSFNRHLALDRVGGDEDLLREVAQIYLAEYPALLTEIRSAVKHGDAESLQRASHTLKGSLATLGAEAGANIAFQLEISGRNGALQSADQDLRLLEAELVRVDSEISAMIAA